MTTLDELQSATAERIFSWLDTTSPQKDAILNVTGATGAGKTTVLRRTVERLKGGRFVPIFVSASPTDTDASAITITTIADQLAEHGFADRKNMPVWDPHRPWKEKLSYITGLVDEHRDRIVLVCDEPQSWYRKEDLSEGNGPAVHAKSISDWATGGALCRRVVSGYLPEDLVAQRWEAAPRVAVDGDMLLQDKSLGHLAEVFKDLSRIGGTTSNKKSVWDLNLLNGLLHFLSHEEVVSLIGKSSDTKKLLEVLLNFIEEKNSKLCEVLTLLTLLRTEHDREVLDRLFGDLNGTSRDLLENCFLVWHNGTWLLHNAVRKAVHQRLRDSRVAGGNRNWEQSQSQILALHKKLAMLYSSMGNSTWRSSLESLHHDILSGQKVDLHDSRLAFVEQLQEVGRHCSYILRDHRRAADIFDLSLQLDANNAYSHHYRAYNLDWTASAEGDVESHYQEAIRIQPSHPWYWSRWITYLLTRGRFAAARHAWNSAEDALSVGENSPEWLFLALHRWVARWLLHWGELDFAEYVLKAIPDVQSQEIASIETLFDMLTALREAEAERCVFPFSVRPKDWWSPSPHTALPTSHNGAILREWIPARINGVDESDDVAYFRGARRPGIGESSGKIFDGTLSKSDVTSFGFDFQWSDVSEGRFVEFGYYGETGSRLIAMHPIAEWKDPHLLPLVPPADRWYRRAVKAAWSSDGVED